MTIRRTIDGAPPPSPPSPPPSGPPEIPLQDVVWLHASRDVLSWPQTSTILQATITQHGGDHGTICIEHTMRGRWPAWTDEEGTVGEGNPWVFAQIDGVWYAATYEWLKQGQLCKRITTSGEWGIGPHCKREPLLSWIPRVGEYIGLMVTTRARDGVLFENSQRSNIVMCQWPENT